jgi:hypothetical protein
MRQFLRDRGEDPPAPITSDLLLEWFNEALKRRGDPKPTPAALAMMAVEINALMERPGGYHDLIREERQKRFMDLWDAATNFRAVYATYLEFNPSDPAYKTSDVLSKVDGQLQEIGIGTLRHKAPKKLGRPEKDWHSYGHKFADSIVAAMKDVGYTRSLKKTEKSSVVAKVGAALIRHFRLLPDGKPTASGFAEAMGRRHKSPRLPPPSLEKRFPTLKTARVVELGEPPPAAKSAKRRT